VVDISLLGVSGDANFVKDRSANTTLRILRPLFLWIDVLLKERAKP